MEVLGVTDGKALNTQVVKVDENKNVVPLDNESSPKLMSVRDSFGLRPVRFLGESVGA